MQHQSQRIQITVNAHVKKEAFINPISALDKPLTKTVSQSLRYSSVLYIKCELTKCTNYCGKLPATCYMTLLHSQNLPD